MPPAKHIPNETTGDDGTAARFPPAAGFPPANSAEMAGGHRPESKMTHAWELSARFGGGIIKLDVGTSVAPAAAAAATAAAVAATEWYRRRRRRRRRNRVTQTAPGEAEEVDEADDSPPSSGSPSRLERKLSFLRRAGDSYGYASSPAGHIDGWRGEEFPRLIRPVDVGLGGGGSDGDGGKGPATPALKRPSSGDEDREVYLDYAGAALPSASQLRGIFEDEASGGARANPHSSGPAASRTARQIERAKKKVLDHFHCQPDAGCGFGVAAQDDCVYVPGDASSSNRTVAEENRPLGSHPGYDILFTSGATASLRTVAESFPWSSESALVYAHNSHTSVVGMREAVLAKGGTFRCVPLREMERAGENDFRRWATEKLLGGVKEDNADEAGISVASNENSAKSVNTSSSQKENVEEVRHLLVVPVECNFGGDRLDVKRLADAARRASRFHEVSSSGPSSDSRHRRRRIHHRWYILADIAKAAATGPVNLKESIDADFAVVSFYKMFGTPTGLGALFVRRNRVGVLTDLWGKNDSRRLQYFGGGSVDAVLAGRDFVAPRGGKSPSSFPSPSSLSHRPPVPSLDSLAHGTVHYRGIAALGRGFDELDRVGGATAVARHSRLLAAELVRRLRALRHGNGLAAVTLYGAWKDVSRDELLESTDPDRRLPGPTVAFNLVRPDGSPVGYAELSNLASLNRPAPLQLRTGCFCNAGACQAALGISNEQYVRNYVVSGHSCGDRVDIVDGVPTGAVRASLGKDSTWEDVDALATFLERVYVAGATTSVEKMTARCNQSPSSEDEKKEELDGDPQPLVEERLLEEMYIYPIKSCGAFRVREWPADRLSGRLAYDREFALVDASGAALRLHAHPRMGLILPRVDLKARSMRVSAPNMNDLVLDLDASCNSHGKGYDGNSGSGVSVCGNQCGGRVWGDTATCEWFSSYLGIRCWLARHHVDRVDRVSESCANPGATERPHRQSGIAFANDAPLLLVSRDSVDVLNQVLRDTGSREAKIVHFRPNLVVGRNIGGAGYGENERNDTLSARPEDFWSKVSFESQSRGERFDLLSTGQCARCQMVDVDPTSKAKGKTLRALAEYRRREGGRIVFGIFLSVSQSDFFSLSTKVEENAKSSIDAVWLKEGDAVRCI